MRATWRDNVCVMKHERLTAVDLKEDTPLYPRVRLDAGRRLRVGVMLDRLEGEAWVERILRDIGDSEIADVAALIINWEPSLSKRGWFQNLIKGEILASTELFWRYCLLGENFHALSNSPFQVVDFRTFLPPVPIVDVTPTRKKYVHRFQPADVEAVRELDLDVILRFGFNVIRGEILDTARHGVWSYHHGDNRFFRGGPAMFWEMYNRDDICGTILQRLSEGLDNGQVLYRSYAGRQDTVWLNAVRQKPYWKSTAFVERSLRALYRDKDAWPAPENEDENQEGKLYLTPSNVQVLTFAARGAVQAIKGNIRAATRQHQWFLAYRTNSDEFVNQTLDTSPKNLQPIFPPKGRNYADPFLFHHEGLDYCFFEEARQDNGKGSISCFRFDANGTPSMPRNVLTVDYHLSYPFLFEWEGEIYMMPETGSTNGVQIFKAARFPHHWEHFAEVISGFSAYDPTLFQSGDQWFLFANIDERGGGSDDELFLFVADTPLGPWRPHPKNPIKSDVRSARPAGQLFHHQGRLIRPAQDCSKAYGGAIRLCEVTTLTDSDYSEHVVGTINPSWRPGLTGCHTISATDRVEVIDYRHTVWRRPTLPFRK